MGNTYNISFWNSVDAPDYLGEAEVDMWHDLGITVAMSPSYHGPEDKAGVLSVLDRAATYGMKVILCDYRTYWGYLTKNGADAYRKSVKEAAADFGSHPAFFGFIIGDEPDAPDITDALTALRINREILPESTPYLNFLP